MSSRRATVEISWQSKDRGADGLLAFSGARRDITKDIAPYLLSLSYADNLTSAADDLAIELEDRFGLWEGDWRPTFGDSVVARLSAVPWLTTVTDLRLGTFAHDKIAIKGPPRTVSLQCVSAPLSTGLRRRKRTRAWRGVTLQQIAADIAKRAGLALDWSGSAGSRYASRNQGDKSDLEFLDDLCKEIGRACKVTEGAIVIFDEIDRDKTPSTGIIDLAGGFVISWSFDGDDSDKYGSCHISFFDPRTGKTQKGEYVDKANPDGMTLELRLPLESIAEAKKKAQSLLRNANRFATRGQLVTLGDPGLVAGVTFDLTGAFALNGKFIITKATHKPIGGYTCTLDVRRCLDY